MGQHTGERAHTVQLYILLQFNIFLWWASALQHSSHLFTYRVTKSSIRPVGIFAPKHILLKEKQIRAAWCRCVCVCAVKWSDGERAIYYCAMIHEYLSIIYFHLRKHELQNMFGGSKVSQKKTKRNKWQFHSYLLPTTYTLPHGYPTTYLSIFMLPNILLHNCSCVDFAGMWPMRETPFLLI